MHTLSFNMCDNWDEHPELQRPVEWRTASGAERAIMFDALVDSKRWTIRLNNFPDEPCFSVLIEGLEAIHFDEWPKFWGQMPDLPKLG